jgi:hypothetical protein
MTPNWVRHRNQHGKARASTPNMAMMKASIQRFWSASTRSEYIGGSDENANLKRDAEWRCSG